MTVRIPAIMLRWSDLTKAVVFHDLADNTVQHQYDGVPDSQIPPDTWMADIMPELSKGPSEMTRTSRGGGAPTLTEQVS